MLLYYTSMWHCFRKKKKKSKYQARQSRLGGTARQWLLYPTDFHFTVHDTLNIQWSNLTPLTIQTHGSALGNILKWSGSHNFRLFIRPSVSVTEFNETKSTIRSLYKPCQNASYMELKSVWQLKSFIYFLFSWPYPATHEIELIYFVSNAQESLKKQLYPSDYFNFPPLHWRNPAKGLTVKQAFICISYVYNAQKHRYTV